MKFLRVASLGSAVILMLMSLTSLFVTYIQYRSYGWTWVEEVTIEEETEIRENSVLQNFLISAMFLWFGFVIILNSEFQEMVLEHDS